VNLHILSLPPDELSWSFVEDGMFNSPVRILVLSLLALAVTPALAASSPEQFRFGHDIHVAAGETFGDVTCLNCSIYIRGTVTGDVFALNGEVVVETGAQLKGDIATLRGDVRLADQASVGGDVAAIAGTVRKQESATVGGDIASLGGPGWTFLVFVVPLAFLGALLAFIVWIISRLATPNRAPTGVTASQTH